MNIEVKRKWVDALRSGEYKQGKGQLRKGDKFCCLGVLCDLHAKETGHRWSVVPQNSEAKFIRSYLDSDCYPDDRVAEWAGLKETDPVIKGHSLATYNDGTNSSFFEIADLIEKNL